MDREQIITHLKDGICTVVFTKKSGEARKMVCTLMSEELPEQTTVKKTTDVVKKVNEEVVSCYDIEAEGWRSFRIDSIVSFEPCCDLKILEK